MAHAEASARTIEAAVTAAAAQLGLRADQVDIEVLEDPVPSTFGYIGSPARVRVTARSGSAAAGAEAPGAGQGGSALAGSHPVPGTDHPVPGTDQVGGTEQVAGAAGGSVASPAASATAPDDAAIGPNDSTQTKATYPSDHPTGSPAHGGGAGSATGRMGEGATDASLSAGSGLDGESPDSPAAVGAADVDTDEPGRSLGTTETAAPGIGAAEPGAAEPGAPETALPEAGAPKAAAGSPSASPSSTSVQGGNGDRSWEAVDAPASSPLPGSSATPAAPDAGSAGTLRSQRRTHREEPIDREVVEADTERAGDFLEGLLDALDVDGDITTWVDEAGGHVDLEGSDLDVLVGSNGETLDALQELTRLAVLRQSKRRVRLLLDINGFRARQRERLISMVQATAEQVIRTREDHEFQPMTPAERKIVHDAVAAIDGARTESLGEDPHRRVVIRPA
ncbi:MAG TPA: RNA-binding cell elongation regulator Jag/EloR [Actinomycetota bacterium]|nr:RNA-binding cell elongation regulator Jag/EloR [Actinomycetota bacterium]